MSADLTPADLHQGSSRADLERALCHAYELVYDFWNDSELNEPEAKTLRRRVFEECLEPHGIPHPRGWQPKSVRRMRR